MSCTLYRFYDKDKRLLYVGISVRGPRRWREHASDKVWYSDVATATMEHFPTTVEALKAEEAAIKTEAPAYNVEIMVIAALPDAPQAKASGGSGGGKAKARKPAKKAMKKKR